MSTKTTLSITELFATHVFTDEVMRERLPRDVYLSLRHTMQKGKAVPFEIAGIVANAMKEWAVSKGATHYSHWFQPMTGVTAQKHDSFISRRSDGRVIMEFSGKELVKGESDASSFPSGGLRCTFEARGYTIWDTTSYAFVKDGTLCIPTAFCSYSGHALDKKTPLLRSMDTLDFEARRILALFGKEDVQRVVPTVGVEQEYFLIDKEFAKMRPDLTITGRTLFGARPPKGQDLDDHYYGNIKPKIMAFMHELDTELWKLGVHAKTKHNEVAPAQYEFAPLFTISNIATDHNQLVMEMLKNVADRHGLMCLLHEKPFQGVNGSGKHNNWSLSTNKGGNLLEPGETPHENAQFLLFLVAVIKAVDDYQDLLRVSSASASNDHRLGANEAPPAIISMFLGDELAAVMDAIEKGKDYLKKEHKIEIGVTQLPRFAADTTDRNRTSPFAFTGNKFEFRMVGSTFSVAGPNIVLNTAVAASLRAFANELENAKDLKNTLAELIKREYSLHKRVVYGGNNYSKEWEAEAKKRGLLNLKSTAEALPTLILEKNEKLFVSHQVFSKDELHARFEILTEAYVKTIHIEALTMVDIVSSQIIPAVIAYQKEISKTLKNKKTLEGDFSCELENYLLKKISSLASEMLKNLQSLEKKIDESKKERTMAEQARFYEKNILSAMNVLRETVDSLEKIVAKKHWPLPSYACLLFSV
ncbi:MAG: glutamine synthetase III [Firmicutes bacterium]|nr:glutamine synthetase III [Bacillota bacterium]